jgi:hypothetical protein
MHTLVWSLSKYSGPCSVVTFHARPIRMDFLRHVLVAFGLKMAWLRKDGRDTGVRSWKPIAMAPKL